MPRAYSAGLFFFRHSVTGGNAIKFTDSGEADRVAGCLSTVKLGMSKQDLDHSNIDVLLEQVGREAVAQNARRGPVHGRGRSSQRPRMRDRFEAMKLWFCRSSSERSACFRAKICGRSRLAKGRRSEQRDEQGLPLVVAQFIEPSGFLGLIGIFGKRAAFKGIPQFLPHGGIFVRCLTQQNRWKHPNE